MGIDDVRRSLDLGRFAPIESEPDGYVENRDPSRIMRGQNRIPSPSGVFSTKNVVQTVLAT